MGASGVHDDYFFGSQITPGKAMPIAVCMRLPKHFSAHGMSHMSRYAVGSQIR